jgi:hypothetical protein
MTPEEINKAIAESVGFSWWAVEKGGWYYRQGGAGYTNRIEEAGRYTEADALKELVRGEPMGVHPIPHPDYCNDHNAIIPVIRSLDQGEADAFMRHLVSALFPDDWRVGSMSLRPNHCFAMIVAEPRQLCDSYLYVRRRYQ